MRKSLMTTNIYKPKGTILIAGECLEEMQPEGFKILAESADNVFTLCLEETHINMAITKVTAILSTGLVEKVIFASVDRSPHCTQLHYIMHEVERTLREHVPSVNYVVKDNIPIFVSSEAIELSKTLSALTEIHDK